MNREKNVVDQGEGVDEEIKVLETEVKNLSFEESEEPKNETWDPLMQNLQNHLAEDSQCQSNNIPGITSSDVVYFENNISMEYLDEDEEVSAIKYLYEVPYSIIVIVNVIIEIR